MMNKPKLWKYLTLIVGTYLMMSFIPEIRVIGTLIEAMGLDMFLLLMETQAIAIITCFYRDRFEPIFKWANLKLEQLDPFYFIPSRKQITKCPHIIYRAAPFLVGSSFIFFAQVSIDA